MNRPRWSWRAKALLSLALTLLLILPTSNWLLPGIHARGMMSQLGSDDPTQREKALNFILREAPKTPAVLEAAIDRLATLPATPAIELFNSLHRLGYHDTQAVAEALAHSAKQYEHEDFMLLMRVIKHRQFSHATPLVDEAIRRLADAHDEQFASLMLAIDAQQQWSRPRVGDVAWLRWIEMRARSESPDVRRSAAMLLAERFDRIDWPESLDALLVDRDPSVRYAAWYAASPRWLQRLQNQKTSPSWPTPPVDAVPLPTHEQQVIDAIHQHFQPDDASHPVKADDDPALDQHLAELFRLERADPGSLDIREVEGLPVLQQVLSVRAARLPDPNWLEEAWVYEDPAVRDLAVLFAAQRFDADELDHLIIKLLDDLNDDAKRSGAVLSALSGRQLDVLQQRAAIEDVESVRQIMRVSLWSVGRDDGMTPMLPTLLQRDGFPATTTLLLMLHADDSRTLDTLLAPDGLTHDELRHLLIERRFIWVLRSTYPALPTVDVWDPAGILDQQLAGLHAYYWLHRWKPKL